MIVGAYALGVHGRPRATGDLDVWVDATPDNAVKLIGALQQFGAPAGQVTVQDFSRPGVIFQMGLPPLRIDVLTALTGLTFNEAWPDRIQANRPHHVRGRTRRYHQKQRATGRARPRRCRSPWRVAGREPIRHVVRYAFTASDDRSGWGATTRDRRKTGVAGVAKSRRMLAAPRR
jgi:hypothetical protein